jgi:hypothetical protein
MAGIEFSQWEEGELGVSLSRQDDHQVTDQVVTHPPNLN